MSVPTAQEPQDTIPRLNMTLEDVPVSLHRAWKAVAALQGLTMKQALVVALREWVVRESQGMTTVTEAALDTQEKENG